MTERVVATPEGRLRGVVEDDCARWRGIPYAWPPIGALRWRAPEPPASWEGVRDATAFGARAVQPLGMGMGAETESSEDCLVLNVCAPAEPPPTEGWPVLLWLHGGGYVTGSATQIGEGEAFARAGVVVVACNYRLGALGFTHLGGVVGPAEADASVCGLLDQIAALRWIRRTVAAFGGDPGRVTIYGVSAGGKSVGNLLAAPPAAGLFARAISSSGGADHVASPEVGTALARRLAAELGSSDPEVLRAMPAEEVLGAQERLAEAMTSTWVWRPTVHRTVLPAVPVERIAAGTGAGIPLLVGNNGNEAVLFAEVLGAEVAVAPADRVLGGILGPAGATALLQTYRASRNLADLTQAKVAAMGDERYGIPTQRLADAQAPHAAVFRYRVDVAGPGFPASLDGGHGTEASMVWDVTPSLPGVETQGPPDPARAGVARQLHRAWVRFIRDGVPAVDGRGEWPRYDTDRRQVMVFGETVRCEEDPRREERLAWGDASWPSGTWFPLADGDGTAG